MRKPHNEIPSPAARKREGRPADWATKTARTLLGHRLVLLVESYLTARSLAQSARGAVRAAIRDIRVTDPEIGDYEFESVRHGFYTAQKLPPPPVDPRDRFVSRLQEWGASSDASCTLVDRLIAIVTLKLPLLGLAYIDRMFSHVTHSRRLRTGAMRIEWLEHGADALDSERPRFPIRPWDKASNASIDLIKSALRDGLTNKNEIATRTRLLPRTVQELLAFMHGIGEAKRVRWGHYVLPERATINYVRPEKAIVDAIAAGADTPEKIRTCTGKSDAQIAGGLHVLEKRGKIVRTAYGRYAVKGAAAPHVYTKHLVVDRLWSGAKIVGEIVEATDRNRGSVWAAIQGLQADGVVKRIGWRNGRAVGPGVRGRVAVFALTPKGRRRARGAHFQ
jgi:hypothetical protein